MSKAKLGSFQTSAYTLTFVWATVVLLFRFLNKLNTISMWQWVYLFVTRLLLCMNFWAEFKEFWHRGIYIYTYLLFYLRLLILRKSVIYYLQFIISSIPDQVSIVIFIYYQSKILIIKITDPNRCSWNAWLIPIF